MAMKNTMRKGIAMIELIFAIVILGITLMSAPMLISQATSSTMVTLQQESIAIAAAHASALMTYAWDDANSPKRLNISRLVNVGNSGNPDLNLNNPNPELQNLRGDPDTLIYAFPLARIRTFNAFNPANPLNAVAPANLGNDIGDNGNDDVDDFQGNLNTFNLIGNENLNANEGEYINEDVQLNLGIDYLGDVGLDFFPLNNTIIFNNVLPVVGNAPTSSNIKLLTVNLGSNNADANLGNTAISLQAFVCNIGGATPQEQGNY